MASGKFPGGLHPVLTTVSDLNKRHNEQHYGPTEQLTPSESPLRTSGGNRGTHQFLALPTPIPALTPSSGRKVRGLPSPHVTDETLDMAYVDFIMYCNPSVPLDTDSTELRKVFRAPPKSDGKSFSTFTLFELIRRLEIKEIKTWAQLVEELGVEKPSAEKNQSSQKVQQYAVRLKRWMHAMHVDAFFEFLNDKKHVYWTHVPTLTDSASLRERDGVLAEDDLALRALLPETRPKRGRRKAEDRDDNELETPSQRLRIGSPPQSAGFGIARSSIIEDHNTPATAHPDFQQGFGGRMVPWSANEARSSIAGSFRWPPDSAQTPMSAYPQSAITPSVNRISMWNDTDEPQSAITPKSRSRRRHGPAVSSAWPSNGGLSSGKVRGRPPSNRSVQEGPYSTFPVNPGASDTLDGRMRDDTAPTVPTGPVPNIPNLFTANSDPNPEPAPQHARPSRLQLQVPERQGGTVRLATPPPVVLVNGQDSAHMAGDGLHINMQHPVPLTEYFYNPNVLESNNQHFVSVVFRQNEDTDRTNIEALESHFICEILAADWYDANGNSIERCAIDEADKICKQIVDNLKAESSSTETFLINLSSLAGGPLMTRLKMTRMEQGPVSHYECRWTMRFGSIEGNFTIRATVQNGAALHHHVADGVEDSEEPWKTKYLALRQQIRDRDEKVGRLKRGVLDALLVSNEFSAIS